MVKKIGTEFSSGWLSRWPAIAALAVVFVAASVRTHALPAFPGAEGHGAETVGGRGGIVVKVTNLNDSGPGSFREALMMTVPRIIVFEVSGTIYLESDIRLRAANSYVTVAGQTAPGDGITIANQALRLGKFNSKLESDFHDGIFRHLRWRHTCRPGCVGASADNISILEGTYNVILDHMSMTWAHDEVMSLWGHHIRNITVQRSIMAEGKIFCVNSEGHNLGPILSGGDPQYENTFHHNYIAHMCYRNYLIASGQHEFINNVNYNTSEFDYHFSQNLYTGSPPVEVDVIGQYFKEGPDTERHANFDIIRETAGSYEPMSIHLDDIVSVDISGNFLPNYDADDPWTLAKVRDRGKGTPTYIKRQSRHSNQPRYPVTRQPAADLPTEVLNDVGATLPRRDAVDQRLVDDFFNGGKWRASNVGAYPALNTYDVPADSDDDGMPDSWETARALDPNDPTDASLDRDSDGYTNIEEYINGIGGAAAAPPPPPEPEPPAENPPTPPPGFSIQ